MREERCNSKGTRLEFLSPAGFRIESDMRKSRCSKWWQGCQAFPSLLAPMTPKSSGSRVPQGFGARGNLGIGESEIKSTSCGVHEMLSFSCALFERAQVEGQPQGINTTSGIQSLGMTESKFLAGTESKSLFLHGVWPLILSQVPSHMQTLIQHSPQISIMGSGLLGGDVP